MGTGRDWLTGVDVGGTFTDAVLIRPGHDPVMVKSPTRRDDPVRGLVDCLDRLAKAVGTGRGALLARVAKLAYGTTQAANMLVEGDGARTGFLTTKGFRDTLAIAGMGRDRIGQDLTASRAPSLVPRRLVHEVSERVVAGGEVLTPLRRSDVEEAIERLRAEGVEAVGVGLLWSFMNSAHEDEVAALLRERTDWFVTTSSECAPLIGEYERCATTALNARLGPPVRDHLLGVADRLAGDGLGPRPLVMTSAGGLLSPADAARSPVSLLSSGPAGGVLASRLLAEGMGISHVLCADMGGTTLDVSLITDGQPGRRERGVLAGHEIAAPAIEIVSVGAGGGSVAWVEDRTRLRVGPRSAGAFPGPACYGRGGERATVTDADCVLGRLNPDGLAGGSLPLDREAAVAAMGRLGGELGLGAEEAAAAVLAIVDASMADAVHGRTVAQGLDPREYTLFAYGGSGALHAAAMAAEVGIARVVVPRLAPVLSAFGVVASHLEHVLSRSVPVAADDVAAIAAAAADLEAAGHRNLDIDGVPPERRSMARSASMRFRGQTHAVTVPLPEGEITGELLAGAVKDFVERYETRYGAGTSSRDAGVECVTLTVRAVGRTPRPETRPEPATAHSPAPAGRRRAWTGDGFAEVDRFVGPLAPGAVVEGPAVVDHPGNTVWVPPGVTARVDGLGSLVMEPGGARRTGGAA
ncbi:hydantoinase/oxoprolinase family protein [Streptomyces sp. NPDC050560]|uniref:hydantoinase/oxoprolinase family protein n=1 Tax=Streptomyces sp. NPDC050560 TaxID=3365630 RepID=UPI00379A9740